MILMPSKSSKPPSTISDIEQTVQTGLEALRNAPLSEQIASALKFLVPPGYRPIAQLEEDGRKKRSTAAASNWSPATGEIVIYFKPLEGRTHAPADSAETPAPLSSFGMPSRFHPIPVQGEPVSATILRDRGSI